MHSNFTFRNCKHTLLNYCSEPAAYENRLNCWETRRSRSIFTIIPRKIISNSYFYHSKKQSIRKIKLSTSSTNFHNEKINYLYFDTNERRKASLTFTVFFFLFFRSFFSSFTTIRYIKYTSRIRWTDGQQWRRSAGIPPLVNAASRRQLEVSSSGWNRFRSRKFFRDASVNRIV